MFVVSNFIDMMNYYFNGEWDFVNMCVRVFFLEDGSYNVGEIFLGVEVIIELRRCFVYYIIFIIFFILMLLLLNVLVFMFLINIGEKMILVVIVLLFFIVFMSVVNEVMFKIFNSVFILGNV